MATKPNGLRVTDIDHIVLRVRDVERAIEFYTQVLGMQPHRVEEYRRGEVPFPCARVNSGAIIDLLPTPDQAEIGDGPRNLDHYCLTIAETDMVRLSEKLAAQGVEVVSDAPGQRSGARGNATSIYIRDPEGNRIELRHY